MELPSPLYSSFFPQMVLAVDELMHYRRLGKERVAQLARIIDDADCVYRWTDLKARNGRCVQKAQFVDIQPATKQLASKQPSTLLKCSIHIVDVQPEEILQSIAKVKTRDARRAMKYLYGDEFIDTRTLLTFPTSSEHIKPSYSYRAIKWSLLKAKRREGQRSLDFCYVEYAGKSKMQDGTSSVVGFCVQDSIASDRQVPTLDRYNILRGQLARSGIVITKTHQSNILKVTAIAQIDGAMAPTAVRLTMEEVMVDFVAAVHRVKGLLERQRMGRLQYLDEWDWVSTKDRKACAVCLRGFYFHRKYHCTTCGEVVCSNCAPLRELEEPLDEHTHSMRVCSVCMAQAGSRRDSNMLSRVTGSGDGMLESTTSTTNVGTETYVGGLRYPKHRELRKEGFEESLRGSLSQQSPVRSSIPPFRQHHHLLSSHCSAQENVYDSKYVTNAQYPRASSELARRERRSSVLRHLALLSSTMPAQAKKEALNKLVSHVRQIRDTINTAISEAEEEEERHSMLLESGRGDPDAGPERYDGIFDRIMKIRETLDVSSSDFDAVLDSIGHNDPVCPSGADSDQLDSDLAFSFSDGTGSEQTSTIESVSIEFHSSRSSLLSESLQSILDHQDAGEALPSPTPEQESAVEEARALKEAMHWVRQSEPTAVLRSPRPVPSVAMRTMVDDQTDLEPLAQSATPTSIGNVRKNRGIERLAHKIGRLHQRLETTRCKSVATRSDLISPVARAVTPTPRDVFAVKDERDRNADDEPEPERQGTPHRSAVIPKMKHSRVSASTDPRIQKYVEIAAGAVASSPSSTARKELSPQGERMSELSRAPLDLVASLRHVMNSSELTHAPLHRHPATNGMASPLESPSNSPSLASAPSRNSFPKTSRRAPPRAAPPALPPFGSTRPSVMASSAPTPAQSTTIYVFEPENRFRKVQRRSLDHRPSKATETMEASPDEVPVTNEDDEHEYGRNDHGLSTLNEELGQARSSTAAAALSPAATLGADRQVMVHDESGELRELMEGLARAPLRNRCSSGQSTGAPPTENVDL